MNTFRIKLQKLIKLLKKSEKDFSDYQVKIFDYVEKERCNLKNVTILLTDKVKECSRKHNVKEEFEIDTDELETLKDLIELLEKYTEDFKNYYVSFKSNDTNNELRLATLKMFHDYENTKDFFILTHKLRKYTDEEYNLYYKVCNDIDYFFDTYNDNNFIEKELNRLEESKKEIDRQRKKNIQKRKNSK